MSPSDQTTKCSTSNFTAILDAALDEYKTLTGQDLAADPFSLALESFDSPDPILDVFRKQAEALDRSRSKKLMACLTPIVNILFTFSATLGEGLVRPHSFYIVQCDNTFFSHSHPRIQFFPELVPFSG